MLRIGPQIWDWMHATALRWDNDDDDQATGELFLQGLAQTFLPCPSCRDHFRALLVAHPRDKHTPWFDYTVALHNHVNAQLEKPSVTLSSARRVWSQRHDTVDPPVELVTMLLFHANELSYRDDKVTRRWVDALLQGRFLLPARGDVLGWRDKRSLLALWCDDFDAALVQYKAVIQGDPPKPRFTWLREIPWFSVGLVVLAGVVMTRAGRNSQVTRLLQQTPVVCLRSPLFSEAK